MKRLMIILAIFLSVLMFASLAKGENTPQVLLIPREGLSPDLDLMLTEEVGVMKSILEKAGFKVVVATTIGLPIKSCTTTLKPDLMLSAVKVDDYVGFILPCMAVGTLPAPPVSPLAVSIVKQALSQGKPVAAQLGSVLILAEGGVLVGKRYAFFVDPLNPPPQYSLPKDDRFTGAIYSGTGVVQDGSIITSGFCPFMKKSFGVPDGTADLTNALIATISQKK
jgi:putative intracellular protease/amidase